MNALEVFKQKEIKNLKKLRLAAWMLLVLVDLGIVLFFLYGAYSVYSERNLDENFLAYVAPTVLGIQGILLLVLVPLGILIYTRFQSAFKEINGLNEEYLQRYRDYVFSIDRAFAGIPPYIFTQRGMVISSNFGHIVFPRNSIDKLTIKIVSRGTMPRNIIKIYQNNKVKSTMTFVGFQTRRLEFLKRNVRHENPYVVIEEMKENTWF